MEHMEHIVRKVTDIWLFYGKKQIIEKILKSIGPNIDPCGTPRIISNHSLKDEPTFTRCCLWER